MSSRTVWFQGFPGASHLKAGHPVVWKGCAVGKVIQTDGGRVQVEIDEGAEGDELLATVSCEYYRVELSNSLGAGVAECSWAETA